MKKKFRTFKRSVLSLALSLSLAVSPLAGTGIEVFAEEAETEAENGGGSYYSQDFNEVTSTDDAGAKANYTGDKLTIASDSEHSNYLSFVSDPTQSGTRGAMLRFEGGNKLSISDSTYIVEFDALLKSAVNGTAGGAAIAVVSANVSDSKMNADVADGYIVKIASAGPNTAFTINGGSEMTLSDEAWYHYKIYVEKGESQVSTTITDAEGNA